jgi:hypothetical protein
MCTSAEATFAWVGSVLINVGFLGLISWGTVRWWPLGSFLSGIYTAFLFSLAARLDATNQIRVQLEDTRQRDRDGDYSALSTTGTDEGIGHADVTANNVEVANQGQGEDTVAEDSTNPFTETSQQLPSLLNLMYGLAVIALGVTLFFLPANLLACHDSSYGLSIGGTWTTDISSIPRSVRHWARPETDTIFSYATFGYLPASGITVFAGSGDSNLTAATLWSVNPISSETPEAHVDVSYPEAFLDVTATTTCFSAGRSRDFQKSKSVVCFDGVDVSWAMDEQGKKRLHNSPSDLIVSDGLLWFKEAPTDYTQRGMLIFSLDPHSMVQTLHSEPPVKPIIPDKPDKPNCNVKATHRRQAIGTLFLVALPVLVVSTLLWQKRKIPSMGLLTYAGATLVFWTTCISINPEVTWGDSITKWWLTVSGLVYMITLVYLILMVPTVSSQPLVWGVNAGAFTFVYGMYAVYMSESGDHFGSWLLFTLTAFAPVTLLGAATENRFLLLLGASGLFADSLRFSTFLADHNGGTDSVHIVFFVLAIAGLAIGAMGMLLTWNQERIREAVVGAFSWLETQSRKCFVAKPPRHDHALTTPLVTPLVAEEGA